MNEAARLARIRAQHTAIAADDWCRVHYDGECYVGTRLRSGERQMVARFDVAASEDEIMFIVDAPHTVGFLLGLLDRAIAKARGEQKRHKTRSDSPRGLPATDRKNYAAEAGMLCSNAAFKAFLGDRHGLERPMTDERTAQRLRTLLGVVSRRDLNDNDRAAERWKALRGDFENWKRVGH